MLVVERKQTDPYFNLAAEEYFLKAFDEDIFMLWRNEPSVIIGKHQNIQKEVHPSLIAKPMLPIIRRITGGGTVYHDLGNVNFTFINNGKANKLVSFPKYLNTILSALNALGLDAYMGANNNLLINDHKISGNAAHVFKNRVIHHGTLLFESKLDQLNFAITGNNKNYIDKAIESKRMKVTNIARHLPHKMNVLEFMAFIKAHIFSLHPQAKTYSLTNNDIAEIERIKENRYLKHNWNFHYSPPFRFKKETESNDQVYNLEVFVKSGLIKEFALHKNSKHHYLHKMFSELLIGKNFYTTKYANILKNLRHQLSSEDFHAFHQLIISKQ
ncbi:MAG: biotin/lipoate A/B protein ligase family protein [Bacteroidales bacterium]